MFGDKLKKLRTEKGLTQEELSRFLNVSRVTIAGYETNRKEPDFEKVLFLAKYFNVTTDYLLGADDNLPQVNETSLNLNEAATVLQDKLTNMDIDIDNGNELEVVLSFIDSNKDMLKLLMNKNPQTEIVNTTPPIQFVAKGGDGVQAHSVSVEDRKKSLEALERLKEK